MLRGSRSRSTASGNPDHRIGYSKTALKPRRQAYPKPGFPSQGRIAGRDLRVVTLAGIGVAIVIPQP